MNMPRSARQESSTGIYHIMLRGINQQIIFNDEEDYQKFLEILKNCKIISEFELYAYCLMNNHIHILIKVNKESLSQIVKRIGVRYVYWYNWKYYRRGHLFQDRYKSEAVEDDRYFLSVLRYIHQNPLKAGIVKNISEYEYSSFKEYLYTQQEYIVDKEFTFEIISKDEFILFNQADNNDKCLEYDFSDFKITDIEAKEIIRKNSNCENIEQFLSLNKDEKNRYIKIFKDKGMSIRQISRLTGVSFGVVREI
jgi:REP element-mobilizing transposase RayT